MLTHLAIGFFASLFAILDPLGNLPIFVGMTSSMRPRVRQGVALLLAMFIAGALLLFLFSGHAILSFFGISVPAFQVAGGIILLLMGLQMVGGDSHDIKAVESAKVSDDDFVEAKERFADVLVPVGVPLFVGPGSISATILFASRAEISPHPRETLFALAGVIIVCSALSFLVLLSSGAIARTLGAGGLAVSTRLMGLILAAMSVQLILSGMAEVMPTIFDAAALKAG